MTVFLLFLFLGFIKSESLAGDITVGTITYRLSNISKPKSFDECSTWCNTDGFKFASIHSADDYESLKKEVLNKNFEVFLINPVWIGLRRDGVEANYEWDDGSIVNWIPLGLIYITGNDCHQNGILGITSSSCESKVQCLCMTTGAVPCVLSEPVCIPETCPSCGSTRHCTRDIESGSTDPPCGLIDYEDLCSPCDNTKKESPTGVIIALGSASGLAVLIALYIFFRRKKRAFDNMDTEMYGEGVDSMYGSGGGSSIGSSSISNDFYGSMTSGARSFKKSKSAKSGDLYGVAKSVVTVKSSTSSINTLPSSASGCSSLKKSKSGLFIVPSSRNTKSSCSRSVGSSRSSRSRSVGSSRSSRSRSVGSSRSSRSRSGKRRSSSSKGKIRSHGTSSPYQM